MQSALSPDLKRNSLTTRETQTVDSDAWMFHAIGTQSTEKHTHAGTTRENMGALALAEVE